MREAVSSHTIAAAAAVGVRNFAGCGLWVVPLIHVVHVVCITEHRATEQVRRLSYPTDPVRALLPSFYQIGDGLAAPNPRRANDKTACGVIHSTRAYFYYILSSQRVSDVRLLNDLPSSVISQILKYLYSLLRAINRILK